MTYQLRSCRVLELSAFDWQQAPALAAPPSHLHSIEIPHYLPELPTINTTTLSGDKVHGAAFSLHYLAVTGQGRRYDNYKKRQRKTRKRLERQEAEQKRQQKEERQRQKDAEKESSCRNEPCK